jgi:AraC family transcriptional regulator
MLPVPVSRSAAELAVCDLARRLFAEPDRYIRVVSLRVADRHRVSPHTHDRWMQWVVMLGCEGEVRIGERTISVPGSLALAWYPGETHGLSVAPRGPGPGEVMTVKLAVERGWPAIRDRVFGSHEGPLRGRRLFLEAMRRLSRLWIEGLPPSPLVLGRLTEMLYLWPGLADEATPGLAAQASELAPPIRAALRLVDRRLSDPPTLSELADAARCSPRHLARQFRDNLGATPAALLRARRVEHAKALLHQHERVSDVADALGFGSLSAFSRWFAREVGQTPSRFCRPPAL